MLAAKDKLPESCGRIATFGNLIFSAIVSLYSDGNIFKMGRVGRTRVRIDNAWNELDRPHLNELEQHRLGDQRIGAGFSQVCPMLTKSGPPGEAEREARRLRNAGCNRMGLNLGGTNGLDIPAGTGEPGLHGVQGVTGRAGSTRNLTCSTSAPSKVVQDRRRTALWAVLFCNVPAASVRHRARQNRSITYYLSEVPLSVGLSGRRGVGNTPSWEALR